MIVIDTVTWITAIREARLAESLACRKVVTDLIGDRTRERDEAKADDDEAYLTIELGVLAEVDYVLRKRINKNKKRLKEVTR